MESLKVGLDSWIIQDGNYGDFEVGKNYKFALEFHPKEFKKSDNPIVGCEYLNNSKYKLNTKVAFVSEECWIVDFGFLAYDKIRGELSVKEGEYYEINGRVGIDPFFYLEELGQIKGILPLIYEWKLNKIYLETTPWVERKDESGKNISMRDEKQESYIEIQKTDAWKDDNGNASYLLELERVNTPPSLNR